MSKQHWNAFGHCPTCEALPGEPCRDLRRRPDLRAEHPPRRAHHNREQLAEPLPVAEVSR